MANPSDIARYFIKLAAEEAEPTLLTHLHLQKLLYYAQGWALAMQDRPLFNGRIEAWTHGPVVSRVYPLFADYGSQPIPFSEGDGCCELSAEDRSLVVSVWESYKKHSAGQLRAMTHQETPWREARGSHGPDERSDAEITHEAMRAFFRKAYSSNQIEGLELETIEASRHDFEAGRVIVGLAALKEAV